MFYVADINECTESVDQCEHSCHNTIGSYTCSCNAGWLLDSDAHTCNGKYKPVLDHIVNSLNADLAGKQSENSPAWEVNALSMNLLN